MSAIDRLLGLVQDVAIKPACRVTTISNITLNGLQTIDGVLVEQDDRVLVRVQTDATLNGIYKADTGNWTRDVDFNGTRDVIKGTLIFVTDGSLYASSFWEVTTDDPIIDDTTLDFAQTAVSSTQFVNGGYVDVNRFAGLESGGNFTAAFEAACTYAVDNMLVGVYFPPRDAGAYYLKEAQVPGNIKVWSASSATLSPFGTSTSGQVFVCTANNIEFQLERCVGVGGFAAAAGGYGAVITAETVGGQLSPGGDSLTDDLTVPIWLTATAYTKETSPGVGDGSRVRSPDDPSTVYVAQANHTSGATFSDDYALGLWLPTSKGLDVQYGGTFYVTTGSDGIGNYFDYPVIDGGGSGGVLRCYVTAGVITRVITHASGGGYTPDLFQGRNILLCGRSRPFKWISANQKNDIRVVRSTFRFGAVAAWASECFRPHVLFNTMLDMGPDATPISILDCDAWRVEDNLVDGFGGGLHNSCGIGLTGVSTHTLIPYLSFGSVINNKVRNGFTVSDFGIISNLRTVKGLIVADNQVESCGGGDIEIKHGLNANATTPGHVPEYDGGLRGIVITGNYCKVKAGAQGIRIHNNLRDATEINVDASNVIECVDARVDPVTGNGSYGLVAIGVSNSNLSPSLRGRFLTGITLSTAIRCTVAPIMDGRAYTGVSAQAGFNRFLKECYFPGEYLAGRLALNIGSAQGCQFSGTRALVRGRSISSVTVAAGGSGGPTSRTIPVYADGGGYGLELCCTVVAGALVTPALAQAIQESIAGSMLLGGSSGTFRVKVEQDSGTGGVLEVTVVSGQATAVSLISAGAGYLSGGSTEAGSPIPVLMGRDFVGYVTTNGSGVVTSCTTTDGGTGFVAAPVLYFDSTVTWSGSAPTLTPVMLDAAGSSSGMYLEASYDCVFQSARLEGYSSGITLATGTNFGNNFYDCVFKSAVGQPYNNADVAGLGVHRNVTQIYGAGITQTARLIDTNTLWSRGESNLIDTSAAAKTIKTINGLRGETIVRLSSASHTLTFDNTGNLYLRGASSIVLSATTDYAVFRHNPVTAKADLLWVSSSAPTWQPYNAELTLYGTKGADIASASTVDLSTATGDWVDITGTTTVTALGTTAVGTRRLVRTTGILTFTHNATSLILPSGQSILSAAGAFYEFRSLGSGNWALTGRSDTTQALRTDVSAAATLSAAHMRRAVRCDATATAFILKLPPSPVEGDWVELRKTDISTNRVTLQDNGGTTDMAWLSTQFDRVIYAYWSGGWVAQARDIQRITDVYTSSTTWPKPPLARTLDVIAIAAGGGGASGRQGAAGSARAGGTGGNIGSSIRVTLPASKAGATETVTIGAGGTSGAAQASASTDGTAGGTGGTTSLGSLVLAIGGLGGIGGTSANTSATSGATFSDASGLWLARPGSASNITTVPTAQPNSPGPSPGGGGGSITTGNSALAGGPAGGASISSTAINAANGGAAGSAGTAGGSISDTTLQYGGQGGGGGGSDTGTGGKAGGDGGAPGGGAGGGGASINGASSGAGGVGGRGELRVTTIF